MTEKEKSLQNILDKTVDSNKIFGASFAVKKDGTSWFGALAFHCPEENLFFAGTVNQVAHPGISFRTMIKLTKILIKK